MEIDAMSYVLTLTLSERQAIDWVGYRYSSGSDLYRLLWGGSVEATPDDASWDDPRDITFRIPENVAWLIVDIIEEEGLPCFSHEFCQKLYRFAEGVV